MSDEDRPGESGRAAGRRARRDAGDRSARVARDLMKLSAAEWSRIDLDEELREAVDRARAVTSPVARRRAERGLAGELRRTDLADVERRLADSDTARAADARVFKLAETWRTRLIAEGPDVAAGLPGGLRDPLPALVRDAQRERAIGTPRGAARALFRHLFALLSAGEGS
jgi:ribosome-associated protein